MYAHRGTSKNLLFVVAFIENDVQLFLEIIIQIS